ncbi:MAG: outer membrane protein assembly factor BamA [Desulfobacteraceae bacterium]
MKIRLYIISVLSAAVVLGCAAWAVADDLQWTGGPVTIHEIVIQVDVPRQRDKRFDWDGLVRDLIAMKHGGTLTRRKLNAAVSALEAFGHVRTKVSPTAQGVVVSFLLLPYQRIKTIGFKGVYPLFERDLRNLMTIAPGDIYDPGRIKEQAGLIARRYRTEGYIDPTVDITWETDDADGHIDVTIRIQKGASYTLGRLELTGNRTLSDALIKGRMSTWRRATVRLGTGRWMESRLKQDIQKLEIYYRKLGFADVRIDYKTDQHPNRKTVDLFIEIDEGPRYRIAFEGNHHFSNAVLREDLTVFEKGNRGNMGLRRSVQNIRRRYLKAGFADVRVRWQQLPPNKDPSTERRVQINIREGGRYIVRQVTIKGNQALSIQAIEAQMLTRPSNGLNNGAYVAAVLQEDIAAVGALYHQHGYHRARIDDRVAKDPKTNHVTVTLSIDEGRRIHVGGIGIEGEVPMAVDRLMAALPLKTGAVFRPQAVEAGENELSARIASKGFPHVQVQTRIDFSEDRTRADIVYDISPGPRVEIGRIFWAGNFRTRSDLLRREIQLNEGEPFSLARVLAAQRRLRDLDLFQSVQMRSIGLKEKASKVHLLVTMVEKSAYFFELGAGFQTDKGFYGRTKVGDRNFLGLNKEIRLGGEISGIGYRVDADLVEPRLLGTRINADLGIFMERREEFNQDFGTDTTGGDLTFSRPWGKRFFTALGISYERREQFLREKDAATTDVDPETLEPRTLWVTTPAVRYDSRDSFVRPHRGSMASLAADISKGLDSSLDNFIKYKLDLRTYFSPKQRLTLAGRAFTGYVQPYGVDGEIPEDQLFFLGGTTDVRGFGENLLRFNAEKDPVGGRLALAGSIEARYALTQKWELTLFVDTGTVQKAPSGDGNGDDQWRWATGLGLRYITPIGPIGLLYGHKIDPRPGESPGQVHFSMGYTF